MLCRKPAAQNGLTMKYEFAPFCAAVLLLSAREGWLAARVSAAKTCATAAAAKERQLS